MLDQDFSRYQDVIVATAVDVGGKVLAAIVFWLVGRWLIRLATSMARGTLEKQKVDATVVRYVSSIMNVTLNVLLVIGVLGYFGVQTTTFAALIAGAGIAIGAAWAGLLANFAAGAFLMFLRPFKVGDFVSVAGITGTVTEIGLFATNITTPDNVATLVGNNKLFGDMVQNFSHNPYRRVDLKCQLAGNADHQAAMALLREKISAIPNVLQDPKVDVEILDFTLVGPVLAVRPYCHNNHYWQVYFDTNKVIREALAAAGFPAPMPAQNVIVTQQS
ncbi:MAG: hypothetical protein RIR70_1286 [Pseudomonadota bacterium]|jgi:small conductance mechanosensitive channel